MMRRTTILTLMLLACFAFGCEGHQTSVAVPMVTDVQQAPWNNNYSDGVMLTTSHYVIYTTTNNQSLLECFPGFMEAAHQNYLQISGLGVRSSQQDSTKQMPIYLMGSRQEWAALTRHILGRRSGLYLAIQAGGYCHEGVCIFWDIGGLGTLSVASHEGMHQFLHHQLKDQLPMWLEEGLCVTAEGYNIFDNAVAFTPNRNTIRFNNLRMAIVQDRWIPLEKLLPMDGGDVAAKTAEASVGYYGQLWALARFLHSDPKYRQRISQMLTDAKAGRFHQALKLPRSALDELRLRGRIYNRQVSRELFRHYISDDFEGFDREFLQFAKRLTRLE